MRRKLVRLFHTPGAFHMCTFSCYQRRPFLANRRTCEWLAMAINHAADAHNVHMWAYVLMPEHVHLLYFPLHDSFDISGFLKSIKQSVARREIQYVRDHALPELDQFSTGNQKCAFQFWQAGPGYDQNLSDKFARDSMFRYIHANPVRRELVQYESDWEWSSARYYETGERGAVKLNDEYLV